MKIKNILTLALLAIIILSCGTTKNQNKGSVSPENFYYKTEFQTMKSVMILPFEINGIQKNFLFDTGADYSLIQRDTLSGLKGKFDGASKRKMELGNEIVASMKFGTVDFQNTIALNGDLIGLKSQIPNFGGLIGQPIIRKANWLIDYPHRTVTIANTNLADEDFVSIKLKRKDGAPYTFITINGKEQKVVIDFGSSSEFNLPEDSELAQQLLNTYPFKENIRERYTLGGLQKTTEKVGIIPLIKIGDMEFREVYTTINVSSQPRIGIGFFKDCEIYIDNANKSYKIKKTK